MTLIGNNNGIFSIDASHWNMVKLGSKNSPDHLNVQSRIIELARDLSAVMSKHLAKQGRLDLDVKRLEPAIIDRRLSRALRVSSKDVENLAPIARLSGDEMIVLTDIGKRTTLDAISVRLRTHFKVKQNRSSHSNALNIQNPDQNLQHDGEFRIMENYLKSDSEPPEQFHIPDEYGDFKDRSNSNESEESDAPGGEGSTQFKYVEQVVAYLKSEEVTQLFGNAVTQAFMRAHRVLGIKQEPKSIRDFTISPASTGDTDHSWPIRFASGKTDITFPIGCRWSLVNEAKAWIEDLVQEPINWWPLRPRIHPLPAGYVRVNWKCVKHCGKRLSSAITRERRSQYNNWVSSCNGSLSSSPKPTIPTAGVASAAAPTSASTVRGSSAMGCSLSLPRPPRNLPTTTVTPPGGITNSQLLMWCVNVSSKLTILRNLEVPSADKEKDRVIFQMLRTEYWRIRGWRRWLSLYTISEIKFVKFELYRIEYTERVQRTDCGWRRWLNLTTITDIKFVKFNPNCINHGWRGLFNIICYVKFIKRARVRCFATQELPEPNKNYKYRPSKEVPPVESRLLMEYFEDPSCAGTSAFTLEAFPKKTNGEMTQLERYGWGLHACEHLSFFRIAILYLSIIAWPTWFLMDWLEKHPGDLQNASVPLFLAFAFIATFTIIPHYFV